MHRNGGCATPLAADDVPMKSAAFPNARGDDGRLQASFVPHGFANDDKAMHKQCISTRVGKQSNRVSWDGTATKYVATAFTRGLEANVE